MKPDGSVVKSPPAIQETRIQSLGWDNPLEKGMATHASILAWENLMDRGVWWAIVHGVTIQTRLSYSTTTAKVIDNFLWIKQNVSASQIWFTDHQLVTSDLDNESFVPS